MQFDVDYCCENHHVCVVRRVGIYILSAFLTCGYYIIWNVGYSNRTKNREF